MSERKRTTVRMFGEIKRKATILMRHLSFTNFTAFLEQLVRNEWDARATDEMKAELKTSQSSSSINSPPKPKPQPPAEHRVESSSRGRLSNQPKTHTARKPRKFGKG